jgi:hypothetical protein
MKDGVSQGLATKNNITVRGTCRSGFYIAVKNIMANQLKQAQASRAHVDVEFSKLQGNVATMLSIMHDIGLLDKRRLTLKEAKITRMDFTH